MGFNNSHFACGVKIGNFIYASCLQFNALVEIDCITWESRVIGCFPNEGRYKSPLHAKAIVLDKKIVFTPACAHFIHIFDLEEKKIRSIEIKDGNYFGEYDGKMIENRIFLVPKMVGGNVWEVDVYNEELHYFFDGNHLIKGFERDVQNGFTFLRTAVINGKIILSLYNTDVIFSLDINTKAVEKIQLGIGKLLGCYASESGIWILRNVGKMIYHWNPIANMITEYPVECTGNAETRLFCWVIENGNNVYAIPYCANQICMLNGDKFSGIYSCNLTIGIPLYAEPFVEDGYVWCLPQMDRSVLKVKDRIVTNIGLTTIKMDELQYHDLEKHYIEESAKVPVWEGLSLSLNQFIEGLERDKS